MTLEMQMPSQRPHRGRGWRLALAATPALLAALVASCGGNVPQLIELTPLTANLQPVAIIVLPVALTVPGATALDVVVRTGDAADYLMAHTDLPILGPFDFVVQRPVDEVRTAASDTDLLTHTRELGFDVHRAIALHVLITENRASNVRDIQDVRQADPKQQKTYRQHGLESTVRVELSLFDAMRGHKLGGLVIETQDDPTDFQPGGDPRPGITSAIRLALDRLMEASGPVLRGRGGRRTHGEGLVDSVPAMMAWRAPDLPSWSDLHREHDDLIREAEALALWDRIAPGLSMREMHDATASKGVLVHQARAPLQAGDVVVSVLGKTVVTRHQLDRLLQQCGSTACPVLAYRAGQTVALQLQWPVLAPARAE